MASGGPHLILLPFNCSFATNFSDSSTTLEIRSTRILLTIVFAVSTWRVTNPRMLWELVVRTFSECADIFGSESGNRNFVQRLLLKHGMVPKFSQTPRHWQPSFQLKSRFRSLPLLGRLEFYSGTGLHFCSNP